MNLFDNKNLKWRRFVGDDSFDYPIDYEAALLSIRDDGHVDLLYRWALIVIAIFIAIRRRPHPSYWPVNCTLSMLMLKPAKSYRTKSACR